jgi:hypothetical protein
MISAEAIRGVDRTPTKSENSVRVLCRQDNRESRPQIFKDMGLFLLPLGIGKYGIVEGEGYFDIPEIESETQAHKSGLGFHLETVRVNYSKIQELDFAYATSLIRAFLEDKSLVLAIRGRKYTPRFEFQVRKQKIEVKGIMARVNAGFEGQGQIALVQTIGSHPSNISIKQLFYPFKFLRAYTKKKIVPLLFGSSGEDYHLWQFAFEDEADYNSIKLVKSGNFRIHAN